MCSPLSALKMRQVCISRTIRLALRIDMQHYSRDLPPVGPFAVGLQKARVRHDVLLVINRQSLIGRGSVGDVGIERRLPHETPRLRFDKF